MQIRSLKVGEKFTCKTYCTTGSSFFKVFVKGYRNLKEYGEALRIESITESDHKMLGYFLAKKCRSHKNREKD